MSRRSYLLFLAFIWIALVYIIVAFTDVTAASFVGAATAETGGVGGGAIAIVLAVLPGAHARRWAWRCATARCRSWRGDGHLPAAGGGAIVLGPHIPFDLAALTGLSRRRRSQGVGRGLAGVLPGRRRGAGVAAAAAARAAGRVLSVCGPGRRGAGPGVRRRQG